MKATTIHFKSDSSQERAPLSYCIAVHIFTTDLAVLSSHVGHKDLPLRKEALTRCALPPVGEGLLDGGG